MKENNTGRPEEDVYGNCKKIVVVENEAIYKKCICPK